MKKLMTQQGVDVGFGVEGGEIFLLLSQANPANGDAELFLDGGEVGEFLLARSARGAPHVDHHRVADERGRGDVVTLQRLHRRVGEVFALHGGVGADGGWGECAPWGGAGGRRPARTGDDESDDHREYE